MIKEVTTTIPRIYPNLMSILILHPSVYTLHCYGFSILLFRHAPAPSVFTVETAQRQGVALDVIARSAEQYAVVDVVHAAVGARRIVFLSEIIAHTTQQKFYHKT